MRQVLSHFPIPCPCSQESCWDPLQWKEIASKEYGIMHELPTGWDIIYYKYQFSSYKEWTVYVDAGFAGHCVNNWFVTSLKLLRVILPVTLTETRIACDTGLWNVSGGLPWLH